MTLDGYCDHTAINGDEEMHWYYADLLTNAGAVLYGRITYQLMEYWKPFVKNPSDNKAMNKFARAIDSVPKIVFSHTLTHLDWKSARLAKRTLKEEVLALKRQPGKDVFVCSPSLIVALTHQDLIDEYQLCVHPVIAGKGLPLFKNISDKINLRLLKSKTFDFGAMVLYYGRADEAPTKS